MGLRDMVGPLDIRISDSGTFTAPDMFESLWASELLAPLRKLDVSRFPMRMAVTFGVEDYGRYGRGLNASATGGLLVMTTQVFVTERDGDRATMITFTETLPVGDPASGPPTSDLLAWARSVLRRVVLHELDECLYVGGERRWDPHAGGRNDF